MEKGIGIGISIPSGALNSNAAGSEIPGLIAALCARSTYCENKVCTRATLVSLQNCTS